jgi:hypothetical protein
MTAAARPDTSPPSLEKSKAMVASDGENGAAKAGRDLQKELSRSKSALTSYFDPVR